MSSDLVISLSGVSKLFFKQEQKTFKEFLPAFFTGKKTREWFWALKDIDLAVSKGASIGIIGPNGSGKSTLLKVIAGVTKPTEGEVRVKGRVAPLIELGAGFHPELTGKENVLLNGVILGMSREEIEEKFEAIVEYSGIRDHINTPIKHYSSGMYLRLAFAVAMHIDPEIILIDEILAVGDERFQSKCLKSLRNLQSQGKTIIIISHSVDVIEKFTTRAFLLNKSHILSEGDPTKVINDYRKLQYV